MLKAKTGRRLIVSWTCILLSMLLLFQLIPAEIVQGQISSRVSTVDFLDQIDNSIVDGESVQDVGLSSGDPALGQVIVKLDQDIDGLVASELLYLFHPESATMLDEHLVLLGFADLDRMNLAIEALSEHPQVVYAEFDRFLKANNTLNDPAQSTQWALEVIDAERAWQRLDAHRLTSNTEAESVYVAVLDTGVDLQHEDLNGRVLPGINIQDSEDPMNMMDLSGHGTRVTGIINAAANNGTGIVGAAGTAPVFVLSVKVLNELKEARLSDIYEAVLYAVNWRGPAGERVRVINMSFGERFTEVPRLLQDAVQYAQAADVLIVAAAGNNGEDISGYFPAALPGVVSVGATGQNHNLISSSNKQADVYAPGGNIVSTKPNDLYGTSSGTSFAAGYVTAAAALAWLADSQLTSEAVRDALLLGQPLRECPDNDGELAFICPVLSMNKVLEHAGIGLALPQGGTGPSMLVMGLTAAMGPVTQARITETYPGALMLEWDPPADAAPDAQLTYTVFRNGSTQPLITGSSALMEGKLFDANATGIQFGSPIYSYLQQDTTYEYRIVAKDEDGNESEDVFLTGKTSKAGLGITTEMMSHPDGNPFKTRAENASLSLDGRYVVFTSSIKPDNTIGSDGWSHIYRYDREENELKLISHILGDSTVPGNGPDDSPSISSDGKRIAFSSQAKNLVAEQGQTGEAVFLYDESGPTPKTIRINAKATSIPQSSQPLVISADGSTIVFMTEDRLIPSSHDAGKIAIYVYHVDESADPLQFITQGDESLTGIPGSPVISADGSTISYTIQTTDGNRKLVYVQNILLGTKNTIERQETKQYYKYDQPSLSGDGRYVSYVHHQNFDGGSKSYHAYVYDTLEDITERISVDWRGYFAGDVGQVGQFDAKPTISADGRYVAYVTERDVVAQNTTNKLIKQVYLFDRIDNKPYLISQSSDGVAGLMSSINPSIIVIGDKAHISYQTQSNNLDPEHSNLSGTQTFITTLDLSAIIQEPPTWSTESELTATQIGTTSIRLDWSVATGSVTNYLIYQNGNSTPVKTVTGTNSHVTITGLTPDTTYQFKVEAGNSHGQTTTGPSTTQVKTAAVSAGLVSLFAAEQTDGSVQLTWEARVDTPGSTLDHYEIRRKEANETWVSLDDTIDPMKLTYMDRYPKPSTTYTYQVFTVLDGSTVPHTDTVEVTTAALSVGSFTWSIPTFSKMRNVAPLGEDLLIKMTGKPNMLAKAVLTYEKIDGNGDAIIETEDLTLIEDSVQVGLYKYSFPITAGISKLLSLTGTMDDGNGFITEPVAIVGFPLLVSGELTVSFTFNVPGGAQPSLGSAAVQLWSASKQSGEYFKLNGNQSVTFSNLIPSDDYTVELLDEGIHVNRTEFEISAGGVISESVSLLTRSAFSVRVINEAGDPIKGERVTVTNGENGQLVGTAVTNEHGIAHPFGKTRLIQGTDVNVHVSGTRILYEAYTDGVIEVPALIGDVFDIERAYATEYKNTGTVKGTILDQDGEPIQGVRVVLMHTQLFKNFVDSEPFYAVTDTNGIFTVEVPSGVSTIEVLNHDYAFKLVGYAIPNIEVNQNQTTEVSYQGTLLHDYNLNVDITIKNENSGDLNLDVNELLRNGLLTLQVANLDGSTKVLQLRQVIRSGIHSFKAQKGDRIEVHLQGSQMGVSEATQTIVTGVDKNINISLEVIRRGIPISGTIEYNGTFKQGEANLYVLDHAGKRGKKVATQFLRSKHDLNVLAPTSGQYLLQIVKTGSPQAIGERVVVVDNVPSMNIGNFKLAEGRFFAGREGNGIQRVGHEATLGMDMNLRVTYRNGANDRVDNVALNLDLPPGVQIVSDSVVLNGNPYTGSVASIAIGSLDPQEEGVVLFKVHLPADQDKGLEKDWNITAHLQHDLGLETIGHESLAAKAITIEVPERIVDLSVNLNGRAPAGSVVDIYGDDIWVGRTTASASGYWSKDAKLFYEGDVHWHHIYAVATIDDQTWRSGEVWTLYNTDQPYVKKMILSMGKQFYDRFSKYEVDVTGVVPSFPYFLLTGNNIYIEVEFHQPEKAENVMIQMEGHKPQNAIWHEGKYVAEIKREDWLTIGTGHVYVDFDTVSTLPQWTAGAKVELLGEDDDEIVLKGTATPSLNRITAEERYKIEMPRMQEFEGIFKIRMETEVEDTWGDEFYDPVRDISATATTSGSINGDAIHFTGTTFISAEDFAKPDQSAPEWASGSEIIASEVDSNTVKLQWTPAVDDYWLQYYRIYQDGQWIATVAGNITTHRVKDLTQGQSYFFEVKAFDIAENSTATKLDLLIEAGNVTAIVDNDQLQQFAYLQSEILAARPDVVRAASKAKIATFFSYAGNTKTAFDTAKFVDLRNPQFDRIEDKLKAMDRCTIPQDAKDHMAFMVEKVREQLTLEFVTTGILTTTSVISAFSGVGLAPGFALDAVGTMIGKSLAKDSKKAMDNVEGLLDSWLEMPEVECGGEPDEPNAPPGGDWEDGTSKSKDPDKKPVAKPTFVYDPSGYVFEAVEDNRLEGVLTTIMYRENTTDAWEFWDADWYGQLNPHYTNAEGRYGWDVPVGWWQVIYEKEGYETAYSAELKVLPEHFDVNIGLKSVHGPKVAKVQAISGNSYVDITFDKYVRTDSITEEAISLYLPSGTESIVNQLEVLNPVMISQGNKGDSSGRVNNELTLKVRVHLNDSLVEGHEYRLNVQAPLMSYADRFVSTPYERTFSVLPLDKVDPIVTMNGAAEVSIVAGELYLDLGATAIDDRDGVLTKQLVVGGGPVNTAIPGTYQILYSATDTAGNVGIATRKVIVIPQPVKVIVNQLNEKEMLVYGAYHQANLKVYNDANIVVTTATLLDKGSAIFALEEGNGYYATQTVNGVESAHSGKVDMKAVGKVDPETPVTPPYYPVIPILPGNKEGTKWLHEQDTVITLPGGAILTIPGGQWTASEEEIRIFVEVTPENIQSTVGLKVMDWAGTIRFVQIDKSGVTKELAQWPTDLIMEFAFPDTFQVTQPDRIGIYMRDEDSGAWKYMPTLFDTHSNTVRYKLSSNGTWALMLSQLEFNDMAKHWARNDVEVLAGRQIIAGRREGHFDPQANITRAEYVTLLLRVLGVDSTKPSQSHPFTDVDKDAWYAQDVGIAWSLGLVSGMSETEYAPLAPITREQMGVLLHRTWQYKQFTQDLEQSGSSFLTSYKDQEEISSWAMEGISFAVQQGIIQGRATDILAPQNTATRAEAAVMIRRFADLTMSQLLLP
ncbi:MAG TPA: S8 family serine peptidase [Candidatus Paenibacillus intestinavium]|nr:S8 family serine peptidase [Candidatus Paenibacillus intestinavium]